VISKRDSIAFWIDPIGVGYTSVSKDPLSTRVNSLSQWYYV